MIAAINPLKNTHRVADMAVYAEFIKTRPFAASMGTNVSMLQCPEALLAPQGFQFPPL